MKTISFFLQYTIRAMERLKIFEQMRLSRHAYIAMYMAFLASTFKAGKESHPKHSLDGG